MNSDSDRIMISDIEQNNLENSNTVNNEYLDRQQNSNNTINLLPFSIAIPYTRRSNKKNVNNDLIYISLSINLLLSFILAWKFLF
jgi:hypothetical protein